MSSGLPGQVACPPVGDHDCRAWIPALWASVCTAQTLLRIGGKPWTLPMSGKCTHSLLTKSPWGPQLHKSVGLAFGTRGSKEITSKSMERLQWTILEVQQDAKWQRHLLLFTSPFLFLKLTVQWADPSFLPWITNLAKVRIWVSMEEMSFPGKGLDAQIRVPIPIENCLYGS